MKVQLKDIMNMAILLKAKKILLCCHPDAVLFSIKPTNNGDFAIYWEMETGKPEMNLNAFFEFNQIFFY